MQDAHGNVYMLIIRKWFPQFWGLSPKSCSPLGEPLWGSSVSSKTWEPGTRSMNPCLKAGGLEARESQFFRPGLKARGRRFYVIQTFSSLQAFHGLEEGDLLSHLLIGEGDLLSHLLISMQISSQVTLTDTS